MQGDLQSIIHDHELQQSVGFLKNKLKYFEKVKVVGQKIQAKIRWRFKGNIFVVVKLKHRKMVILAFKDEEGFVIIKGNNYKRFVVTFITSCTRLTKKHKASKNKTLILETFLKKFIKVMNFILINPISMEKLHSFTKSMVKSKSHGLDGVVANLYLNFCDLIRELI
jgi:hypothetical protein